ncbi:hypothetical protein CPHO_12435 (plasmid) [Corynebacterium phocae]|uniref:Uncharacterized protein n=1 Tax=Corynebacterium phocae TaxID=161895 RepID=A0A1L7D6Y0_9CORY|nr:hypothetical protein CPHO_12435 [Corynebacterium phocae]
MPSPNNGYRKAYRVRTSRGVPVNISINKFRTLSYPVRVCQFIRLRETKKAGRATDTVIFRFNSATNLKIQRPVNTTTTARTYRTSIRISQLSFTNFCFISFALINAMRKFFPIRTHLTDN